VIVEQLVEWRLAGETEVLGENLPQRHFVHHKFHLTRPGREPGPLIQQRTVEHKHVAERHEQTRSPLYQWIVSILWALYYSDVATWTEGCEGNYVGYEVFIVPPKRRLDFNGLHGIISHDIERFRKDNV
jgi:hypothetical protein